VAGGSAVRKPAARLPEPAARLPEPAARLPEPAARPLEPAARLPEPAARPLEPAARLPELATVYWRQPASDQTLSRVARWWTLTTVAHTVPFVAVAALLAWLSPLTIPVGVVLLAHAWIIPELYAARGANVVRRRANLATAQERIALGLLGDLVGHDERELLSRTGLVVEPGAFGAWVVGDAGAFVVRPGGRRVHCYCVKVTDPELPPSDRVAHLLLALRSDESGFATVANLAFCGACWRLRRRLPRSAREALDAARAIAR
jgi:hypothetical protein